MEPEQVGITISQIEYDFMNIDDQNHLKPCSYDICYCRTSYSSVAQVGRGSKTMQMNESNLIANLLIKAKYLSYTKHLNTG